MFYSNAQQQNNQNNQRKFENPSYRVRFFFIRHGLSCSNIAKFFPKSALHKITHAQSMGYRDPELSQIGIQTTTDNGVKFRNYLQKHSIHLHHIGSSTLMRAIQSAWFMLAKDLNKQIQVMPYLSEKKISIPGKKQILPRFITDKLKITASNTPLPYQEQNKFLNQYGDLVNNLEQHSTTEDERFVSSLPKFLKWFEKHVDNFFKSAGLDPNKDTLNFALVCHGTYIRKELNLPKMESYNNIAVVKQYIFNLPSELDYDAKKNYSKDITDYCPNKCRQSYIPCPTDPINHTLQENQFIPQHYQPYQRHQRKPQVYFNNIGRDWSSKMKNTFY